MEIIDTREENFNRIVKLARLKSTISSQVLYQLHDPHIIWMNKDRFTLARFERVYQAGREIDYAQSWLCMFERKA